MCKAILTFVFLLLLAPLIRAQSVPPPTLYPNPEAALQLYRSSLTRFRQEYANHRPLPDLQFFLFGMGNRTKFIYRNGRLLNALTGNIEEQWNVQQEIIVPSEYLVHLVLNDGRIIQIREDETGVWLVQPDRKAKRMDGTRSPLTLPRFSSNTYGLILRVLHQEILINVLNNKPLPNLFVYQKPWYRDAALMAMVLRETGNLHLIRDWVLGIRDPFDRNNRGIPEADNPGQVLFLTSLVSDRSHPVVQMALDSVKRFQRENFILGKTDYAEHSGFQTKWLKYGLKSLGLPDPYVIPVRDDSYSSLFWMDYKTEPVPGKRISEQDGTNYPYLIWAEDHFYGEKRAPVGSLDYPLSWEQQASAAHYPGMTILNPALVKQKIAFPHTWHAAEMFLRLYGQ
ncbi:hypothetical protein HNV11_04910 [Spirosoma taeanense]|uniref:Uncharacterized protein n=1 Tax=Spirosoma taeanense TaxID=2735870 RepID=A0A6M5Y259_9BACT|nr:hypothetical protein [Spirosoma taeanense]QJW88767.1 hypothetical protein HNV11_04910 [Spirosoma taeanense]